MKELKFRFIEIGNKTIVIETGMHSEFVVQPYIGKVYQGQKQVHTCYGANYSRTRGLAETWIEDHA